MSDTTSRRKKMTQPWTIHHHHHFQKGRKMTTQPWTIHRKKDLSRRKYYYNKITKETTWNRPVTLGPEVLDDAYYVKTDKRSGKTYYVCISSKKTKWKLPEEGRLVDAPTSNHRKKREKKKKNSPPPVPVEVAREKKKKDPYVPPPMPEFINTFKEEEEPSTKPPPIPQFATSTFSFNQMNENQTPSFSSTVDTTTAKPPTKDISNQKTKDQLTTFRGNIPEAITRVENIMKRLDNLQRIVKPE